MYVDDEYATETAISDVSPRDTVTVMGRVTSVSIASGDEPPNLMVRVDDGTGTIDAVLMGRRGVPGIEPGCTLRIHGRVTAAAQRHRIFNPAYEIIVKENT